MGARSAGTLVGILAVSAFALLRFVVWDPPAPAADLESSWHAVLHEARALGWHFGRDLVFSHGPYGFVKAASLHPATYATSVALQSLLALWLAAALWVLLAPTLPGPAATAGVTALLIELLVTPREGAFFLLVLLPVLFAFPDGVAPRGRGRTALLHASLAAAALAALAKFSFALGAAWVAAVLAADALGGRRGSAGALVTLLAALLLLWLAAGQPLAGLGDWLGTSWELSRGFAAAMGLPGPPVETGGYALVAALAVAAQALRLRDRNRVGALLGASALAGLLALVGKAAFARHDWHASAAWSTALPLAMLLCLRARAAKSDGAARMAAAAALLAALGFAPAWVSEARIDAAYRNPLSALPGRAAAMGRALSGRAEPAPAFERARGELARRTPLPAEAGPSDWLGYHQAILLASGLEYAPRPVFQGYSAYTEELARLNADHLAGPRAPRSVFLHLAALDDRYPSLDDAAALPVLLEGYDSTRLGEELLWLRRRSQPRALRREDLGSADGELGRWIEVPNAAGGAAIWVEIGLRPTTAGALLSLALRPPRLELETRDASGGIARHRLIAELAASGFLLSPRLATTAHFAELAEGRPAPAGRRVVALRVVPATAHRAWSAHFPVRFTALARASEIR